MGYITELRKFIGSRPIISVGATILVNNEQGQLLFQHRSDTNDWGLPGGSMELGETVEEVAIRELHEETGLVTDKVKLIGVFSGPRYQFTYPNGDQTESVIHLFHAHEVTGTLQINDDESFDLAYFSQDALPEKIEKRAHALLEELGTTIWALRNSFDVEN